MKMMLWSSLPLVRWLLNWSGFLLTGAPITEPGFMVDDIPMPVLSPYYFNHNADSYVDINKMVMDEGDVLLCCPVKTGQHWNFEILRMLLDGKAEYSAQCKESLWIDIHPFSEICEQVPRPRVLCTHLPMSCVPFR